MTIPIDVEKPDARVIEFKPAKDRIEIAEPNYDACKHRRVSVSERDRTLTCRDCEKLVDPITYIVEWAKGFRRMEYDIEAWKALHEDRAGQAFDDRFKKDQAHIRGRPTGPEGTIWDEFARYFGDKEFSLVARRKAAGGWYGHGPGGSCLSIEYVRSVNNKRLWKENAVG